MSPHRSGAGRLTPDGAALRTRRLGRHGFENDLALAAQHRRLDLETLTLLRTDLRFALRELALDGHQLLTLAQRCRFRGLIPTPLATIRSVDGPLEPADLVVAVTAVH